MLQSPVAGQTAEESVRGVRRMRPRPARQVNAFRSKRVRREVSSRSRVQSPLRSHCMNDQHPTEPSSSLAFRVVLTILLCSLAVRTIPAQQGTAEVVRGRVANDSGKAVIATVVVTRGP